MDEKAEYLHQLSPIACADKAREINLHGPTIIGDNGTIISDLCQMDHYIPDNIKNIPRDVDNFIGRKDILNHIEEAFREKTFVVIQGMAGIGKSATAIKFAHKNQAQYQNMIWVDMKEVLYTRKAGKCFEEISRYILRALDLHIHKMTKSNDVCSHLQSIFRRLYTAEKKTLIVLDNSEECLAMHEVCEDNLSMTIKMLVKIATEDVTSKGRIHILGTSRCIADEQYFNNNVTNIRMVPFTQEETGEYLNHFEKPIKDRTETLHRSSCGCPLFLEVFSKILSNTDNSLCFEACLDLCKAKPGELAIESSPHVKNCLKTALDILEEKERKLAVTLSTFEGSFFVDYAKKLCYEVGSDFCCIQQLRNKGIICIANNGFTMHPFLQTMINETVPEEKKLDHRAALAVVYIRELLELGKRSFEKDKLSSGVKEFYKFISHFDHMISILQSFSVEKEKEKVKSMIEKDAIKEQDPCSFYLLLRFLYPLVPRSKIQALFQFLLEASCQKDTKSLICACLDELDWNVLGSTTLNKHSNKYERVMLKRRQLSDKVKDAVKDKMEKVREGTFSPKMDSTFSDLKGELTSLMGVVESLENEKIRAYYSIKVNKLLGKVATLVNDPNGAIEYLESSRNVSESTFGVTFWTVDIYSNLAEVHAENEENDTALKLFEEARCIAENSWLIDLPMICTLFWTSGKFYLKHENLRERAIEPLEKVLQISYGENNYEFFSKALVALCNNFTRYSHALFSIIDNWQVLDKVFIGIVDNTFKYKLNVTNRSTEKETILRETKAGIAILQSGISYARCRIKTGTGGYDVALLETAVFDWNRNIAIYCPHVMLESERKRFADDALKIAEKNKLARKDDLKYLTFVSKSNKSEKDEQMILEVSFLEKTNKTMKRTNKHAEQKERVVEALNNCKLSWVKLKLFTCLLELSSGDHNDTIELSNKIADILHDDEYSPLKPLYVIIEAIDNINLGEVSDELELQVDHIFQVCIRKLEGPSQREKDMKCKFQIRYITFLLKCSNANPYNIKSFMQTVLDYGKQRKLKDLERVRKDYQKYIEDHTSSISRLWKWFVEMMIYFI